VLTRSQQVELGAAVDRTHAAAANFHRHTRDAFDDAADRTGITDRHFRIGGWNILLRFAGVGLLPRLTPTLEHRATAPLANPDLTIGIWDTVSTGVSPAVPCDLASFGSARGEIPSCCSERIMCAFPLGTRALSVLDLDARLGYYWCPDPDLVPLWETTRPFRALLGWWASSRGGQLVHGAAVGGEDGGLLIVGAGGAGKSTIALACLEAGLGFAGDDYVLIRTEGGLTAFSAYNSAKLEPAHLKARFPNFAPQVVGSDGSNQKLTLLLHEAYGASMSERVRLSAIVAPTITPSGPTRFRRISSLEVLTALAPSTMFALPGLGPEALRTMSQIVQRVPGYRLEIGRDLRDVVAAVGEILERHAESA
jgi:hypothetical protein